MSGINNKLSRAVSALLCTTMLTGAAAFSLPASALSASPAASAEDRTLFSSSFELDEASTNGLLLSEPDGSFYENLTAVGYESSKDGLAVRMSTLGGSSDYKSEEGKSMLFDGNSNTKFLTESDKLEVFFRLEKQAVITSYKLTSANDAEGRDPVDFTLYGSADGSTWVQLDRRTSVDFAERYQDKTFTVTGAAEFSWYRLSVTKNAGESKTQLAGLALYGTETGEEDTETVGSSPMSTLNSTGPSSTWCNYSANGWTGYMALMACGKKTAAAAYARNVIFDNLDIKVTDNTRLSYVIFPALFNGNYDYYYTSMHFVIDLKFDDGTYLSSLGAADQNGMDYTPEGQASGEALYTMQWNYVETALGTVARGKTIRQILVYFDMKDGVNKDSFLAYFDDIVIEDKADPVYTHLSDYINILRGTNSTSSYSRGLTTPAVTLPNGFNFYSPVTDPTHNQTCYTYQLSGSNNTFDSMSVMHVPSNWVGSWGTWQFMANTSISTEGGVASIQKSDTASDKRKAEFSHINETANAHYYSVTFDKGSAASGVRMEVTPTSHAMYARFTFPAESENVNLVFDSLWGSGSTATFNADGTFQAFSSHTSGGSTGMYIYGKIDTPAAYSKSLGGGAGIVSFADGTTVVTMKLATSYISYSQAKHNLELEIADSDFDGVFENARKSWDDICGIIELEGASYTELVTFYSCMYRLYAYPNLYSENTGTEDNPVWAYASPYRGGKKVSGKLYVNNGFWDTYRTTWAAYGLFTEALDSELLCGMVQHYIDQGWVPRWVAPGGCNSMVGTSSDVIFADAYIKGIPFDYENAYLSMLKSASVVSSNLQNGGREETATSPFIGYITNATGNGFSWTMEGYINDYGVYVMSKKLGRTDEAAYYLNRCLQYVNMFNSNVGFFMGKNASGGWSSGTDFNPANWWGDFTEASGWTMAFTSVYDVNGLANLYGGKDAFADKLDAYFDDSVAAMKKVSNGTIHEMREAVEVRMGQYAHNNQPSHHIAYLYDYTNEPYKTQSLVRTVLSKLYVGSEIGQGYCGDEDNGEMSAWYIFSALGFYPLSMGSGEYVIGSPLFDKATIHLDNGKDIVINAVNNSAENVYIQSCKLNGADFNSLALTHEQLKAGAVIEFTMGSEPSAWGTSAYTGTAPGKLSSLSEGSAVASPLSDILTGRFKVSSDSVSLTSAGTLYSPDIASLSSLVDNTSESFVKLTDNSSVIYASSKPHKVSIITLTSAKNAARTVNGIVIEASNDGESWMTLDKRTELTFDWAQYTLPISLPEDKTGMYLYYRLTFSCNSGSTLAELELIGSAGEESELNEIIPDSPGDDAKEPDDTGKTGPGSKSLILTAVIVIAAVILAAGVAVAVIIIVRLKKTRKE